MAFAYEYNGYWKDVGTLQSYWESNMELIDIVPEFNLYEEFWKIYTKSDVIGGFSSNSRIRLVSSVITTPKRLASSIGTGSRRST